MIRIRTAAAVSAALGVFAFSTTTVAQDPLKTGSNTVTLKFENEKVRVLEWNSKPGDKEPIHQHPDMVVVYLTSGSYTSTAPDGKSTVLNVKAGDTVFKKALAHSVENTGGMEVKAILVEFKQ